MTEDDRRISFLERLAEFGLSIGAKAWEVGFADDCRAQFSFSRKQVHVIDGLRTKYEAQLEFLVTGRESATLGSKELERLADQILVNANS